MQTGLDELRELLEKKQRKDDIAEYNAYNKMYMHVRDFVSKKKLICYGGLALDMLLPKSQKIYKAKTIADYDCFSSTAKSHAKELARFIRGLGYNYVEVKMANHPGTYKVYAEFQAICDVTQVSTHMFKYLNSKAIVKDELLLCPPEFLLWSLYKELARPEGSAYRWEKIYKRYLVFLKYHRLTSEKPLNATPKENTAYPELKKIIKNQVVIGTFGASLHVGVNLVYKDPKLFMYDVISDDPEALVAEIQGVVKHAVIKRQPNHRILSELIPEHICIYDDGVPLVKIYVPDSCYSFTTIDGWKVGSIDTVLYYLYGYYMTADYLNSSGGKLKEIIKDIIIALEKHQGPDRFKLKCLGHEKTMVEIRKEMWNQRPFVYRLS